MSLSKEIVTFWRDAGPTKWFARDDAFDAEIRTHFEPAHFAASRGEHGSWLGDAEGALALQILLDQFPRNCFRDSAHSYATDGLSRHYARRAIGAGLDQQVDRSLRVFLYLPFEHSESLADQNRAVNLIEGLGDAEFTRYAELHRDIIQRFGRFPHRNAALGRESTQEELEYLTSGGFAG